MNKLNPKTRFIIFLITTLIVVGGFGWYNYGVYSDINEAIKTAKLLALTTSDGIVYETIESGTIAKFISFMLNN